MLAWLAVVLAFVLGPGVSDTTAARAELDVAGYTPLVIRGLHFKNRELVRVTLRARESETQRVRATRAGSFRVRFTTAADACSGFRVEARGARGSRASLAFNSLVCRPSG